MFEKDFEENPEDKIQPAYQARTDRSPVVEPWMAYSRLATIGEENCHYEATTDKRCDKMPPGMNLKLRVTVL